MGPLLLILLAALTLQQPDTTSTYADAATQRLIERAMQRHLMQDSAVSDYSARLRYRLSFSLGRRRFARIPVASVEEQEGMVQWQLPNDLRVEILGRRARARSEDLKLSSAFSRPWFVPRGLGDSVRIFGNDFPQRAALHPLAEEGPAWYRYAIVDSLLVTDESGRAIRLFAIEVTPARTGPALIAGKMWLDSTSAEVVRLSFRYVGTQLWVTPDDTTHSDSASARRANSLVNRILSIDADLEYGLQEGRYWMPYRQVLSGLVQVPLVGDFVIPFEARTTFEDYTINRGRSIVFTVPLADSSAQADSGGTDQPSRRDPSHDGHDDRRDHHREHSDTAARDVADRWPGGRFEIHQAPEDSLRSYSGWSDSLQLDLDPGDEARIREVKDDLARLAEHLPAGLTGRRNHGVAYERFADIFRYDRVQGLSAGIGYQTRVAGMSFTTLNGTARFGLSDARLTARLALVKDAPSGRWTLSGYREIASVDPFQRGQAFGNSLNAIFAGHDNSDYYLAQGATLSHERSLSRGLELSIQLRAEDQRSVISEAHSAVNDFLGGSGRFPANPPIDEETLVGLTGRLDGFQRRARWMLGSDVLRVAGRTTVRGFGEWRQPIGGRRIFANVTARAGVASAPTLQQAAFRLGGLGTVRGFDYGTHRGQGFWAIQADWAVRPGWVRPIPFLDAGQVGAVGSLLGTKALVGGGIGLSILNGLIRFDLSHAITPDLGKVRFDLEFLAPR